MSQQKWSEVDDYFSQAMLPPDAALDDALRASEAAGLPAINVTPHQGKLLHLLARLQGAKLILEVGTLGGYSTIWLARALPSGGRLITLELDPQRAAIARANLARAGLEKVVDIRVGPAADSLAQLARDHVGPFDFVFIDANKSGTPEYFTWALQLTRPGSVIVVDNVVRDGAVTEVDNPDPNTQGIRRFLAMLAAEPRVDATAIQTVGGKGYDGFAIALVTRA